MSEAETVWDWPYLKVMSGHNGWYTFIMMKRVTITEGGRNGLFLLVPPDKSPSLNPPSRHDYHHQACRPPRLPNVGHLSPSRPMAGARWHRVNDGINYVHDTSTRRLHCCADAVAVLPACTHAQWLQQRSDMTHLRLHKPLVTPSSTYCHLRDCQDEFLGLVNICFHCIEPSSGKTNQYFSFFLFSSCLFAQLFASASINKSIPEASCYDNLRHRLEHSIHTYPNILRIIYMCKF